MLLKRDLPVLGLLFAAALFLRIGIPATFVFKYTPPNFQGGDAWYHVRVAENLVRHPLHRLRWDYFASFPGGEEVPSGPLFDYLIAGVALIAGHGSADMKNVYLAAAWIPAVLGALVVIPLYVIGRLLLDPLTGLLAAAFIAVMPGIFLRFSMLGAADHHVAETLFAACTMLFCLAATKTRRPYMHAAAAGICLGCYLATWVAGAFLVAILLIWIVCATWLEAQNTCMPRIGLAIFSVALAVFAPCLGLPWSEYSLAALAGSLAICGLLFILVKQGATTRRILISLAVAAVVPCILAPAFLRTTLELAARFRPQGLSSDVSELRPLLFFYGPFSVRPAWLQFGVALPLAAIGLVWLAVRSIRKPSSPLFLFVIWTACMLAATLAQVRMVYYFAVNAALLSGFVCRRALGERRGRQIAVGVAILIVLLLPNFALARYASLTDSGPSPQWREALQWMRKATTPPFGDESYYYAVSREGDPLPASAYGVMNWWDFGYWIIGLSHRAAVSNGTQAGAPDAAQFFTSEDEHEASAILERLRCRYVVIDGEQPVPSAYSPERFAARIRVQARQAGKEPSRYYDLLYRRSDTGTTLNMFAFYEPYFRTMAARLTRGSAATSPVWAIQANPDGEIVSLREFAHPREAAQFVAQNQPTPYRIACFDPRANCFDTDMPSRYEVAYQTRWSEANGPEFIRVIVFR